MCHLRNCIESCPSDQYIKNYFIKGTGQEMLCFKCGDWNSFSWLWTYAYYKSDLHPDPIKNYVHVEFYTYEQLHCSQQDYPQCVK